MTAGRVLSADELSALLDDTVEPGLSGLRVRPLPAVLGTDFIRTGLHHPLAQTGKPLIRYERHGGTSPPGPAPGDGPVAARPPM